MPVKPGDPLKKVTLNLYHDDVIKLQTRYGYGWSEKVRELVREKLREPQRTGIVADYVTEDLEDE